MKQDQTPKYNNAFEAIHNSTALPIKFLIRWGIDVKELLWLAGVTLILFLAFISYLLIWSKQKAS